MSQHVDRQICVLFTRAFAVKMNNLLFQLISLVLSLLLNLVFQGLPRKKSYDAQQEFKINSLSSRLETLPLLLSMIIMLLCLDVVSI